MLCVTKQPNGLSRLDGKRPDGLTLIPWQEGKPLCWDVMVICHWATLTCSLQPLPPVLLPSWPPPARSQSTAHWKTSTSSSPLLWTVEYLGAMNCDAPKFLSDLGRRISLVSGDDRETTFLFQRISVLLFRFNSVLLHNSLF